MRSLFVAIPVVVVLVLGFLLVQESERTAFLAGAGCLALALILGAVGYGAATRRAVEQLRGPRLVREDPAGVVRPPYRRGPGRMDGARE